jgi:hypothetical protein
VAHALMDEGKIEIMDHDSAVCRVCVARRTPARRPSGPAASPSAATPPRVADAGTPGRRWDRLSEIKTAIQSRVEQKLEGGRDLLERAQAGGKELLSKAQEGRRTLMDRVEDGGRGILEHVAARAKALAPERAGAGAGAAAAAAATPRAGAAPLAASVAAALGPDGAADTSAFFSLDDEEDGGGGVSQTAQHAHPAPPLPPPLPPAAWSPLSDAESPAAPRAGLGGGAAAAAAGWGVPRPEVGASLARGTVFSMEHWHGRPDVAMFPAQKIGPGGVVTPRILVVGKQHLVVVEPHATLPVRVRGGACAVRCTDVVAQGCAVFRWQANLADLLRLTFSKKLPDRLSFYFSEHPKAFLLDQPMDCIRAVKARLAQ